MAKKKKRNYGVRLRKFPFPFSSMLAICSDLDETSDFDCYVDTIRYLNTSEETRAGKGVNLEVGNSIYFYMVEGELSYWNMPEWQRRVVRKLIKAGLVDCIHSYGDRAYLRSQIEKTLAHLQQKNCEFKVWIDHAEAPSNIGKDIMKGFGDVPGARAYHSDITAAFGVEFVWLGRVSSIVGQDSKWPWWEDILQIKSARQAVTISKEITKHIVGHFPKSRYSLHVNNKLLTTRKLSNNKEVIEFMRCNPSPHGVSSMDTMDGLGRVLNAGFLRRLARREGTAILYTHLGKMTDAERLVPPHTQESLHELSDWQEKGEILVATTTRLLQYKWLVETFKFDVELSNGGVIINQCSHHHSLDGLTFEISDLIPKFVHLRRNGTVTRLERLYETAGHAVYGIPWKRLKFPDLAGSY